MKFEIYHLLDQNCETQINPNNLDSNINRAKTSRVSSVFSFSFFCYPEASLTVTVIFNQDSSRSIHPQNYLAGGCHPNDDCSVKTLTIPKLFTELFSSFQLACLP